jgi:hypothetical protein
MICQVEFFHICFCIKPNYIRGGAILVLLHQLGHLFARRTVQKERGGSKKIVQFWLRRVNLLRFFIPMAATANWKIPCSRHPRCLSIIPSWLLKLAEFEQL